MKTANGLVKALGGRYDGPTKEIRGMTYIPWNYSLSAANDVFDPDGFDIEVRGVQRIGDGFMAIVRITAHSSDGRPVARENVGFSDIAVTQKGQELVDTAIKAAVSDAISRTLKLFGDAFGLYLYEKDETPQQSSRPAASNGNGRQGSAPARSNGGKRSGPTEKQVEWLVKKGVVETEDEAREMTFEEAKAALDEAFNGGGSAKKSAAPAKASRRTATPDDEDEGDDLPF